MIIVKHHCYAHAVENIVSVTENVRNKWNLSIPWHSKQLRAHHMALISNFVYIKSKSSNN